MLLIEKLTNEKKNLELQIKNLEEKVKNKTRTLK